MKGGAAGVSSAWKSGDVGARPNNEAEEDDEEDEKDGEEDILPHSLFIVIPVFFCHHQCMACTD